MQTKLRLELQVRFNGWEQMYHSCNGTKYGFGVITYPPVTRKDQVVVEYVMTSEQGRTVMEWLSIQFNIVV